MYAIISDGVMVEYPVTDLGTRFPQVSFPAPMVDSALPEGVVRVVLAAEPEYDPSTHKLERLSPSLVDDVWVSGVSVVPLDADTMAEIRAGRESVVRSDRDRLLQQSDWTQLADAPVDSAAWAAYRQALRDVPSQSGFPYVVSWPTTPV